MEPKQFFPGIHGLRFLAAALVVIEHAGTEAHDYTLAGYSILIPHFYFGRVGVILFFAISGFVIALQRTKPVGLFVQHRLLRIYPSYWIATAAAAILFGLVGRHIGLPSPASIFLYPSTVADDTFTIPYWTLVFEMTFYTLAAVAFRFCLSDRTLTVLAVLWIIAVNLAGQFIEGDYSFPGALILISPAVQIFPMGLICGIHFNTMRRAGRWPFLIAAPIVFCIGTNFDELTAAKLLMDGISASCLIVAVADLGSKWKTALEWIGDTSYGIYLIHFPIIYAVAEKTEHRSMLFFFTAAMVGGVGFGRFDHWLYERLKDLKRPTVTAFDTSLRKRLPDR